MRLERVTLENFRCFASLEIPLHPELTILTASNGCGKTAILDAIRIALWPFIKGVDLASKSQNSATIQISDVRLQQFADGNMEPQIPCSITTQAMFLQEDKTDTWKQTREKVMPNSSMLMDNAAKKVTKYAKGLESFMRQNEKIDLPLISYLGTSRLWFEGRFTSSVKDTVLNTSEYSRSSGYLNCLAYASSFKSFATWYGWVFRSFREEQLAALEKKTEISDIGKRFGSIIKAVSHVVDALLKSATGWHRLEYKSSQNQQLVMHHDELGTLPVEMLSDGIRNAIAMVADIAFRAYKLNPHLGEAAPFKTSGIVLIDEVDIFLHPTWQQNIVPSLREAFPRIQFIVTTYSPQVVSSVANEHVYIVENGKLRQAEHSTLGAQNSLIIEGVFGGNARTKKVHIFQDGHVEEYPLQENIDRYFSLIRSGESSQFDSEEAKAIAAKLEEIMPDDPILVQAREEISRARRLEERKKRHAQIESPCKA